MHDTHLIIFTEIDQVVHSHNDQNLQDEYRMVFQEAV